MSTAPQSHGPDEDSVEAANLRIVDAELQRHLELLEAGTTSQHQRLDLVEQQINRQIRVRVAGCDLQGNELGEEGLRRDANIIEFLHGQQIVRPQEIRSQITKFRKSLAEVGGDRMRLNPKDFSFMNDGGHIPSEHLPGLLLDICRGTSEKTYALLLEYFESEGSQEVGVPFGYHFGFTQLPCGDTRFPSLEASDIAGKNGEFASTHADKIWAPWRVGLVKEFDEETVQQLQSLGCKIPDYLHGKSARRRGLNTRFKPVYAGAAKQLGKNWITYNTATIHDADVHQPAIGIPNYALRKSNEEMFMSMGDRNHTDPIKDGDEMVAIAEWEAFGNSSTSVLDAALRDGNTLKAKGGHENKALFMEEASVLARVLRSRQAA